MTAHWHDVLFELSFWGAMAIVAGWYCRWMWRQTVGARIVSGGWISRRLARIGDPEIQRLAKQFVLADTAKGSPLTRNRYGELAAKARSRILKRRAVSEQNAIVSSKSSPIVHLKEID